MPTGLYSPARRARERAENVFFILTTVKLAIGLAVVFSLVRLG